MRGLGMVLLGAGAVALVLYSAGAFASDGPPPGFQGDAAAWKAWKEEHEDDEDGWSVTADLGTVELDVSESGIDVDIKVDADDIKSVKDWLFGEDED